MRIALDKINPRSKENLNNLDKEFAKRNAQGSPTNNENFIDFSSILYRFWSGTDQIFVTINVIAKLLKKWGTYTILQQILWHFNIESIRHPSMQYQRFFFDNSVPIWIFFDLV